MLLPHGNYRAELLWYTQCGSKSKRYITWTFIESLPAPGVGMTVERPGFTIHSSPSLLRILCCEFIYSPNSFATPKLILKVLSVIPLWEQNSWVVMLPSYVYLAEAQQSDALPSYYNSYIINKCPKYHIFDSLCFRLCVYESMCVCFIWQFCCLKWLRF